jgi:carbon storage regulator
VLVLTRKIGERLRIGPDIEVVVLDVRGREVRVGVTAPSSVSIQREELYRQVQDANRAAAQSPTLSDAARAARALLPAPAAHPSPKDGPACES